MKQFDIQVHVDITADQITPDSADILQVTVVKTEDNVSYEVAPNDVIQGTRVSTRITSVGELQMDSETIDQRIADLTDVYNKELAAIQAEKDDLTLVLTQATEKANAAIQTLQGSDVVVDPVVTPPILVQ